MTVAEASRAAFKKVALQENEAKVLGVFRPGEKLRDEDIAERLGWGIQSVTGRVKSLLDAGRLVLAGNSTTSAGNRCRVTSLPADDTPKLGALTRGHLSATCGRESPLDVKCPGCGWKWTASLPEEAQPSAIERIRLCGGPADFIAAHLGGLSSRAA